MAPKPIEPDTTILQSLAFKLNGLSLPLVEGEARSPISQKLAQRKFQVFENEAGVNSVSLLTSMEKTIGLPWKWIMEWKLFTLEVRTISLPN